MAGTADDDAAATTLPADHGQSTNFAEAMGMLVQRGTLTWLLARPVAVVAAVAGDQLGYLEGRMWGPKLRTSRVARRVGTERWNKAEATVACYGIPAVIIGRCLAGIRTVVPRIAGSSGLPYRRFLAGSCLWAGVELSAGQFTGWVAL
ncbi:DedA family protein [Amycolatopsis sulphurea]